MTDVVAIAQRIQSESRSLQAVRTANLSALVVFGGNGSLTGARALARTVAEAGVLEA